MMTFTAALTRGLLFPLFFLCWAAVAAASGHGHRTAPPAGDATILIYHHFGDSRYPTTNVEMTAFAQQMKYLAEHDYRVLPLAEAVTMLHQGRPLPPRSVVITIDDGYRSVYSKAWPLLRKHNFPFTVFLYVEGLESGYPNYLTWKQVREMQAAGVDFQDHSYSHHRMADRPAGMDDKTYRGWIGADLARSRALLTARLGRVPRFFAIPYGEYNSIVIEEARKAGYEAILTQDGGSVSDLSDRFLLPREPILGKEWATLSHFKTVLERVDLPLADFTPSLVPPLARKPARFGARIIEPERYLPDSFGIYVSELGWTRASLENGVVSMVNSRPLSRRLNRVMISAREREGGRTAVRFWLLMHPSAQPI
jgi:peptidoglycan/xylan/chitin deacetylase (PgdA/CDA1 family)